MESGNPQREEGTQLETDALFRQYLNVVNRAVGEHRDETPYKQIMEASEKLLGGKKVQVAVYKSQPKEPHHYFTIALRDGTFDLEGEGKSDDAEVEWKVKDAHLREVVDNPNTYVENPAKLDLDWLRSRARDLFGSS